MSLVVKKFGGTSVGNIERIEIIADQLLNFYKQKQPVVVVVSAMKGETDRLENLAYKITDNPDPREMAAILATGEQLVISLLAIALIKRGCPARSYTGLQLGIETEGIATKAKINSINTSNIHKDLDEGRLVIVAGFQGIDSVNGNITTLGRGGSDTTAVALSIALRAKECHIYTDVDGVYTADPNIVTEAKRLDSIDFTEMLELSGLGAKVMQIRAVELGCYYNLPIRVMSSFKPMDGKGKEQGTLISSLSRENHNLTYPQVIKIASIKGQVKILIKKIKQKDFKFVLNSLADLQIEIDLLSVDLNNLQDINISYCSNNKSINAINPINTSNHDGNYDPYYQISFVINHKQLDLCKYIFSQIGFDLIDYFKVAKISLVGLGLSSNPDIINKLYSCLLAADINIQKVVSAETKVSMLLNEIDLEVAVNILHSAFLANSVEE